jgi:hypothetical protein
VNNLLQFFACEHLPPHLQAVSKPIGDLARDLAKSLPPNPESTVALRKLLEAKDCAARAMLWKAPVQKRRTSRNLAADHARSAAFLPSALI